MIPRGWRVASIDGIYAEFAPQAGRTLDPLRRRTRHCRPGGATAFDEEHSAVNSKGMMAALVAALAGLLGIGSAQAQVQASGSAALTSDYVWRGSSQSDGDPAVQAGAKVSIPSGWYASVWVRTFRSNRTMARAASSTWWRAGPAHWHRTGAWMPT